jgi:hypothetical protein
MNTITRNLIIQKEFDENFWNRYTGLWLESSIRSPFQSPAILKYFCTVSDSVLSFLLIIDDKLMGGVLFKLEKGRYTFLSDHKTDTNYFTFHKDCSGDDIAFFHNSFLKIIKKNNWNFELNYQPDDDEKHLLINRGKSIGLHVDDIPYSVCPLIAGDTPEGFFRIISGSSRFKIAAGKTKKNDGVFEVLTGSEDIDQWHEEFCNAHIERWENTDTPSRYKNKELRIFLLGCLNAWSKDKVLLRFSLKIDDKRIAFVIGLLQSPSMIHHSHTYLPGYQKLSPGTALIYNIAEWMASNNLKVFDFGYGDEKYKFELSNREIKLHRIFISHKMNYPFRIKTNIIRTVKENPKLYKLYQKISLKLPVNS